MSDYHLKKGKYTLPKEVYNLIIWTIRNVQRLKEEKIDSQYTSDARAVTHAMEQIPEEYRQGVIENITQNKAYPPYADRSTYSRWKSRFIHTVARILDKI